jgi:hypothetical protein
MSASPTRQAEGASSFRFLLTHRRRATGYREPLGREAPSLTMLWIPPGRFWMGSPPSEPERTEAEGPQHLVQLEGFFLAQTPITQAQWREVAGWEAGKGERWGLELNPNPSWFKSVEALGHALLLEGEESPVNARWIRELAPRHGILLPVEPTHRPDVHVAERSTMGIRLPRRHHHAVSLWRNDHKRAGQLRRLYSACQWIKGSERAANDTSGDIPGQRLGFAGHAWKRVGMVPGSLAWQLRGSAY